MIESQNSKRIMARKRYVKDKRVETLSGRIFEQILVWILQKKMGVIAQQIDMQHFDVIAFDKSNRLGCKTGFKNDSPALIDVKARGASITGVSFKEAERALEYGNKLGVDKLLYAACFFDSDNIGDFDIYLMPIEDALKAAKKLNLGSIRFKRVRIMPTCFKIDD